jgi:Glycosyl hydrolase family 47
MGQAHVVRATPGVWGVLAAPSQRSITACLRSHQRRTAGLAAQQRTRSSHLRSRVQEAGRALRWIADTLAQDALPKHDAAVITFEATIRVLGGTLSAHHMLAGARANVTLAAAINVGLRLLSAFQATGALPAANVWLHTREPNTKRVDRTSIAQAGTLALEFGYLARVRCRFVPRHEA